MKEKSVHHISNLGKLFICTYFHLQMELCTLVLTWSDIIYQKKQSVAMLMEKPMATILTSNGNSLRKRDLDTLQDNNRLNDVIIDTYLKMICDRSKNSSNLPKVFAFSTFFCQSIRRYQEYNRILSGFCKKEDLFSFDIIFGMCAKHMIDTYS